MKRSKFLALALLTATLAPALSSCSGSEGALIIRVLNSEDYIYLHDPKNGYNEPDLVDQFADYIASDPELKAKYGKVKVVYNTADTMENIYSEMQTGKTSYDLICASDYIIAKMARFDLIKKIDKSLIPNYFGNQEEGLNAKSSYALTSRLDNIKVHNQTGDTNLGEYAVGYMWGTLGVLFNPEFYNAEKEGYDLDSIIDDNSEGWKTDRMGKVELSLLRLAVYEMLFDDDIPTAVAMDEAVELAKTYGQDNSGAFVNAILTKVKESKKLG